MHTDALALSRKAGDKAETARSLRMLGVLYRNLDDEELASQYLLEALDHVEERRNLPSELGRRRPAAAAVRKLDIDDRRQLHDTARHRFDEVPRLVRALPEKGEVMVGADRQAEPVGFGNVLPELTIAMIPSLRRLEIGEGDIVAGDGRPVDDALVMRDVDAAHRKARAVGFVYRPPLLQLR